MAYFGSIVKAVFATSGRRGLAGRPRRRPPSASRRGLGGEHAGRRSCQAAHGRRRAAEGAKGAPAAENKPSDSFQWMQPEARAVPAGLASAGTATRAKGCAIQTRCRGAATGARFQIGGNTGKCHALRDPADWPNTDLTFPTIPGCAGAFVWFGRAASGTMNALFRAVSTTMEIHDACSKPTTSLR